MEYWKFRRAVGFAALTLIVILAPGCTDSTPEGVFAFDPEQIPDAYRHPTAALMWPGSTRAFQITPEGNLYNGEWSLRISASAQNVIAPRPSRIAYEDRWRPVAHWRRHSDPIRWDFEAAALPPAAAADSGLVVTMLITATNTGRSTCEARLVLELAAPDSAPLWVANDLPVAKPLELRWAGRAGRQLAHGWCEGSRSADRRILHLWN